MKNDRTRGALARTITVNVVVCLQQPIRDWRYGFADPTEERSRPSDAPKSTPPPSKHHRRLHGPGALENICFPVGGRYRRRWLRREDLVNTRRDHHFYYSLWAAFVKRWVIFNTNCKQGNKKTLGRYRYIYFQHISRMRFLFVVTAAGKTSAYSARDGDGPSRGASTHLLRPRASAGEAPPAGQPGRLHSRGTCCIDYSSSLGRGPIFDPPLFRRALSNLPLHLHFFK